MRYKITRRLTGYFSAVLLVFSVVAGGMFWAFFTRHTARIQEEELKKRAVAIADTLSVQQSSHHGMGMGHGAYIRLIDDIAMSEVWLVDERAQTIEMGHMGSGMSYSDLPAGAEALIQQVFDGNVESGQSFSSLLEVPSITVGAPVRDRQGRVNAAILMHSPIEGLEQAQRDGITILAFCILAALVLATGLSVLLAGRFIMPLQRMGNAAKRLMDGDYLARTGVLQDDEIGLLARNIDELALKLSEVEKERKELDKMRQDFVSNISHELRTPVTVIKGSLEVLDEGLIADPQEMKEYFHQMLTDTSHLERLVNDLLELSRLQNASFQIEKTGLNLTDVLTEAVHSMQRAAAPKQVVITLENELGSFFFWGDYGRLRQMFTIILDNAIKFSQSGQSVHVRIQRAQGGCQVAISDHGMGIPGEDIPYIFDRFYRERSEKNKSGSGLGLSIAKQIAARHGVEIRCESKVGEGTSFFFLFMEKEGGENVEQE